ncbi:unnamed protein product [Coregonus sp. 'balchen']|nr:unnamed protein product [Coregonus sp. 'balchen']
MRVSRRRTWLHSMDTWMWSNSSLKQTLTPTSQLTVSQCPCPLYAAVDAGHTEMVELLVWEGAEGHSDIVRVLVGGCDLDVFDKDYVVTPLLFAAAKGHQQCVQILIDCRPKEVPNKEHTPDPMGPRNILSSSSPQK